MRLLLKEALKKIRLTFGRFLSVFFIVALGVGFFAGIRNTSDDMLYTAASYYEKENLMDLRLVSTLGFTDKDKEYVEKIDGVKQVEVSYYLDCLESSNAVRIMAMPKEINKFTIVAGRMPKNNHEVLADSTKYKVGDKLTLDTKDLKETKVEVVGLVKSPMYIQFNNKGTTLIGNGKIYAYIYTNEENFNLNVYTVMYIKGTKTSKLRAYTDAYQKEEEKLQNTLNDHLEELKTRRYEEVRNEAQDKIDEAYNKIQKEENKNKAKLIDAKATLDRSLRTLQKKEKELNEKEQRFNAEIKTAKKKLEEAKKTLSENEKKYQEYKKQYDQYKQYIDYVKYIYSYDKLPDIKNMTYEEMLDCLKNLSEEDLNDFLEYVKKGKDNIESPDIDYTNKEEVKKYLDSLFHNEIMDEIKDKIDFNSDKDVLTQLKEIVIDIEKKLSDAKKQIDVAKKTIRENEALLNQKEKTLKKSIADAKVKIKNGYSQVEEGYATYNYNYNLFQVKFKDAYKKLEKEAQKIDEIKKPDIYNFTREDNAGYEDYKSDATRVNNISKVFPVFFLLVAALVCLNTMSRMVEEDRGQMGIYKSLGFNNHQILLTYILYVAFATIFGSLVGLALGCSILPSVIYNIYSFIYMLPKLQFDNNVFTMVATTILMFAVTLSITLYAALSSLKEYPASLLRPKAPAKGKKVLLENIDFIWKRLNFSFKVTTRNIFRYKKRIFMTVVGIAGCTALTLAGLGLKDSITGIIRIQFNDITKYRALTVLNEGYSSMPSDTKTLLEENGLKDPTLIYQELYSYKLKNKNNDVYLVVPSVEKELKEYISLRHRTDKKELNFDDDGAIVTEKMANNLKVSVGEFITIYDTNNKPYKIKVSKITENYAYNYVYLSPSYYKKIFNKDASYNMVISGVKKNINEDKASKKLLASEKVLNVTFVKDTLKQFNNMVSNLNKIVFVILLCSCLLAFIVLYNLTTINITERIREIATLKVLGFNDKEVSLYVYRETMILTVLGAFVGLFLGVLLHKFVITAAEMEFIMFQRNINGISYVYAFIITIVFSLIISAFTHFKLKKIDMIEALKSVE